MAKVGLVFGGRSVEHRVSVDSARTVSRGLAEAGHEVVPLGIAPDGCWLPPERSRPALAGEIDDLPLGGKPVAPTLRVLLDAGVEILFPVVHGTWGEDGSLQGLAEMLDLPYVGTGVLTSSVAMDKILTKRLVETSGVPVVEYEVVERRDLERLPAEVLERLDGLEPPLFVKPAVGGSSVGITRVTERGALQPALEHGLRFDERLLVERGVSGRELECAVLGYGEIEASEVGEIIAGRDFYDYADKYLEDGARLDAPAHLTEELGSEIRRLAVAAFRALGGWGMARVDFLLEPPDRLYLNEINTLPGFTSISMYPRLWELSGVPLPELVSRLVEIARARHRDRCRLDQGIKDWIADLRQRSV